MRRFYGAIGYETREEVRPDVWEPVTKVVNYYGDILQNDRTLKDDEKVNDNLSVGNRISIVADPYAMNNFFNMKWIEWMGVKWKIRKVEVQAPRLLLSLGEAYARKQ